MATMMQGKVSPFLLGSTLLCGLTFAAAPPPVLWEKNLGQGIPRAVLETSDGGFVVAGWVETGDGVDALLVKTDAGGGLLWRKSHGEQPLAYAQSILQTSDGGFVVGGWGGDPNTSEFHLTLEKIDPEGKSNWSKKFGGGLEAGGDVVETADGGYVLAGTWHSLADTGQDAYLVKTDGSGNLVWETHVGSTGDELINSVAACPDGGFVVAGTSSWPLDLDIYLAKFDGKGELLWEKSIGTLDREWGTHVISNAQGNYIVAGTRISLGNRKDICLLEVDPDGNVLQEGGLKDRGIAGAWCVQETREAGYAVSGFGQAELGAPSEVLLVNFDKDGAPSWQASLGQGVGWHFRQTKDGGFVVVAEAPEGIRLVKVGGKPASFNFRRGRTNADGVLDLADAVALLRSLFGGAAAIQCEDAADANDDGKLNISDGIVILGYLFGGKGPLPAPFTECGPDETEDQLTCAVFEGCK